jgi:hypothetical protein
MSLALGLIGAVIGTGYLLNKEGRQTRKEENIRMNIDKEEEPSDKNIYHSERFYDAWDNEFERATRAHLKAQDPVNENVVPLYYNDLGTRSELSPELQSYLEKRGNRLKGWDSDLTTQKSFRTNNRSSRAAVDPNSHVKFINEKGSGNEVTVDESPMFNPLGTSGGTIEGFSSPAVSGENEKEREREMMEQFTVADRKSDSRVNGVTKQEHFQSYTIHGPANSNNPNYHNNMVPFFGSKVTQNTDPLAHQTTLEYYTGQTNADTEFRSRPKREIPSLQDRTPGQTYIYGSPADNSMQRDRYVSSTLKTGITPFQQIRVGPGISGSYDWKPRDGFQSWFRCPEKNVDELRVNKKNVYEGRLLPGKEQVTNRGILGDVHKRRPDTYWVNDQRRWFKTTGSYAAPEIRQNFVAYKQNREDTNIEYTGIAGAEGNLAARPGVYLEDCDSDTSCGNTTTVYDRCTGKPIKECFNSVNARVQHSDKNQLVHTTFRNVGSNQLTKNQKNPYDTAKTTTRQTLAVKNYNGIIGTDGNLKNTKYYDDEARTTTRQTVAVKDYQGIVGQEGNLKNEKYFDDDARTTTRQTLAIKDYNGIIGHRENMKNQKYLDDDARTTTRQTVAIKDYNGVIGNRENLMNQKYLDDDARTTTRQTVAIKDYQGIAGNEGNLKNQKYLDDDARTTTRQTVAIKDYQGVAGSDQTQQPVSYEACYNATTNNNQEGLLENRAYGPNKSTNIAVGACDVNMQIRARTGYDVTRYGPNENRQYSVTPSIGQNFSQATSQNNRSVQGIRQPEDFVVEQHRRNPYTQSLQSATPLTTPFRRGETPFNGCDPNTFKDPNLYYGVGGGNK